MKRIFLLISGLCCFLNSFGTGPNPTVTITPSTKVVVANGAQVTLATSNFVNNGTYVDSSGTLNVVNAVDFTGSGTTRLENLTINTTSDTSVLGALVSVYHNVTIAAGSLNTDNNLYLRADIGAATMVNDGALIDTVRVLVTTATQTIGGCPYYTPTISTNITGTEMVYQWQSSADSSTWTNVSGATNATYTPTVMATAYYRCNLSTLNTAYTATPPGIKITFTGTIPTITLGPSPVVTHADATANLPYTATTASPTNYSIVYSSTAIAEGFSDVTGGTLTTSPIVLTVPATATPAVYTGTVTVSNGCISAPHTFSVTINNSGPVFNGGSTQNFAVCENSVGDSVNSLLAVTDLDPGQTETWNVTSGPTHGTLSGFSTTKSSGTAAIMPAGLSYTPVSGYSGADAFTIQVSDGDGGVASTVITVTVNPLPVLSSLTNQNICNGAATSAVNFSSTVSGTSYSWTNSNTSIGLAAAGTGNIGPFTINDTSADAPVPSTIIVTTSANGCAGSTGSFTITADPTPTADATAGQALCNHTATSAITFSGNVSSTVYSWTNTNSTIGLASSGTGSIGIFTVTNSGSSIETGTVTVTPSANGCSGSAEEFTITVYPTPNVSGVSSQSLCNGVSSSAEVFNGTVSGTTYNWTNSNTSIGIAASGTGNISSFFATDTSAAIPVTATINVIPAANGCAGSAQNFTITVNPIPDVNAVSEQTVCANGVIAAINFDGVVSDAVYEWTNSNPTIGLASSGTGSIGSFTATNTSDVVQTATLTVTPTANGCSGSATAFTIIVNPTPTVAAVSSQVLCNGASTAGIVFSGAVSGSTYSWTNSNTSIGLAASGTGNINSFFAVDTSASAPEAGTINVVPTANGCNGAAQNFSITVNPIPDVNAVSGQTVCANATITATNFNGTVSDAVYTWTNSNPSIGLASSGTGSIGAFTATNTTSGVETGTITVTPYASGCTGTARTFAIVVNPIPTVGSVSSQILCNGSATSAVNFSGTVSGTSYSWTNSNTSIGLAANGTGNIGSFFANDTSASVPEAGTISVAPSANGCAGSAQNFSITVNPIPDVNAVSGQTVCTNATIAATNFNGNVSDAVYTWTNSNSSIGLASSGTGSIGTFTATNTTSGVETATVTVTPSASGCSGSARMFTIIVNPMPTVGAVSNQALCNGNATTAVNFSGTVSGTAYSWTNSNTSIGLGAYGTGNIGSFFADDTSAGMPETGIISVTPSANGCTGSAQDFTITVHPIPDVNAVSGQTVCANTATAGVNFNGMVSGTVYTWTNSNPAIGLASSGTGNIGIFTATNATSAVQTATVTVTPTDGGCSGAANEFTIVVNPTPTVARVDSQTLCSGTASAIVIFNGSVSGTNYTWTNSNSSIGLASTGVGNIGSFTASNTTGDAVIATISVTPEANGCAGTAQDFAITADPIPTVATVPNQTLCNGVTTDVNFAGDVSGETYSWTNSNSTLGLASSGTGNITPFTAINGTAGIATTTVTVTPSANGCSGVAETFAIIVNPTPRLTTTLAPAGICDSTLFSYTPASGTAGTAIAWSRGTIAGISNPAASGTGAISEVLINNSTAVIAVTYADTLTANGCVNTENINVAVSPKLRLSTTLTPAAICDSTLFDYLPASATPGTTFTWSRAAVSGIANPAGNGIDSIKEVLVNNTTAPVSVTYVDTLSEGGCVNTEHIIVTVNPTPLLTTTLAPAAICDNNAFNYIPASATVGTTYAWSRAAISGISTAANNGSGNIHELLTDTLTVPVAVAYVDTLKANGCVNTQTVTVTVKPQPLLTSTTGPAAICDSTLFSYVPASNISGATFAWVRTATAGLSNASSSGTGNPGEHLYNTTTGNVTANYTYNITANGCESNPYNVVVAVRPTPKLTTPLSDSICSGAVFNYTPESATDSATFAWTRAAISGISNAASAGAGSISEVLTNVAGAAVSPVYVYTISYDGCSLNQDLILKVEPTAPTPVIATAPPNAVCDNTLYQNFGAATPEPTGVNYVWTADNALVRATGITHQYCLVNFNNSNSIAVVTLTAYPTSGRGCSSVATYSVSVSSAYSDYPVVGYAAGKFTCEQTELSYQWGYDDKITFDSTILTSETGQNYINASPDPTKDYWVMVENSNGCLQKAYPSMTSGIINANSESTEVKIYPNPATTIVNVSITTTVSGKTDAALVDLTGQQICKVALTNNTGQINVANLAAGTYFINCYRDGIKIHTDKIVKE